MKHLHWLVLTGNQTWFVLKSSIVGKLMQSVVSLTQIYHMLAWDFLDTWPVLTNPSLKLFITPCATCIIISIYLLCTQLNLLHPLVMLYRHFGLKGMLNTLVQIVVMNLLSFQMLIMLDAFGPDAPFQHILCFTMVFWSLGPARNNLSLPYNCTRVLLRLSFYTPFYIPLGFHYLQHLQLMKTIQEPLNLSEQIV